MVVINSIDKSRLSGDTWAYSGDGVAWKARVVLFMGFAAMAGGLAGGVTVMVLKYVTEGAEGMTLWFGVANLLANALVMLRYVNAVTWGVLQVKVVVLTGSTALWCSGSARTWRTTIPTTWLYDAYVICFCIFGEVQVYRKCYY